MNRWVRIQKGLERIAAERHNEDLDVVKLLIGVMIQAAKDSDLSYFGSDDFHYHCFICGLVSEHVQELITKATDKDAKEIPYIEEDYTGDCEDF